MGEEPIHLDDFLDHEPLMDHEPMDSGAPPPPPPPPSYSGYNPDWCPDNMLDHSGETCDDGNDIAGDGCDPTCQVEPGWECTPTTGFNPTPCYPAGTAPEMTICGNGIIEGDETCDDATENHLPGCDWC